MQQIKRRGSLQGCTSASERFESDGPRQSAANTHKAAQSVKADVTCSPSPSSFLDVRRRKASQSNFYFSCVFVFHVCVVSFSLGLDSDFKTRSQTKKEFLNTLTFSTLRATRHNRVTSAELGSSADVRRLSEYKPYEAASNLSPASCEFYLHKGSDCTQFQALALRENSMSAGQWGR